MRSGDRTMNPCDGDDELKPRSSASNRVGRSLAEYQARWQATKAAAHLITTVEADERAKKTLRLKALRLQHADEDMADRLPGSREAWIS